MEYFLLYKKRQSQVTVFSLSFEPFSKFDLRSCHFTQTFKRSFFHIPSYKFAGHNKYNVPLHTPNLQIYGATQAQYASPYPKIINPRGITGIIRPPIPQNSKSAGHNKCNVPFHTLISQIHGAKQAQYALPYPQPTNPRGNTSMTRPFIPQPQ